MPKLEPYRRESDMSYALGIFPSMNLLAARPEAARRLLLHPDGLESEGVRKLRERCAELGVREEMAERVLRRESRKDNCYAAIAFEKYFDPPREDENVCVFCQISDSGNLGTAIRAMLGFGIGAVALVKPCVDMFEPHAVRASMGAIFHLRAATYESFSEFRKAHSGHNYYPFMLDGAIGLSEAARAAGKPFALVFGNEQTGLPAEFQNVGQSVMIPQSDKIDSFNLAVAASVAAYAFTQER